ncbi:HD domain-containing protein [candidate division WOR-3 bacterium]|nr:HD domain-containing protein [candidate division WOR-3 bacterium]
MNRKYIETIFPQVEKIRSKKVRDGVINAWLLAIKRGKWKKIEDIPFTLLIKTERTLIQHTRTVTDMVIAVARTRRDLDLDTVIAAGLVHDVGKLLEYCRRGRTIVKSSYGRMVRHPVSGFCLALEVGLPLEVAHIIAAHSTEGEKVARSKEAIVIHHCDFIDFDIARAE